MHELELINNLFLVESDRANKVFDDEFYSIYINYYDSGDKDRQFLESVSGSLSTSISKFFNNLITAVRNYINKFKNFLSKSSRESSYISTLNSMEKQIRAAKADGKTKVTMLDYPYIRREYNAMCNDLKKYGKKFVKMKYKSTVDIEHDLEEFERLSDNWEKKMREVITKKRTMSIDDALRFIENEKRGKTHVFDTLNDLIQQLDDLKHVADETARRTDTLGSDVLKEYVSFSKRVANKISKTVTGFISKTIAVNVLLFA